MDAMRVQRLEWGEYKSNEVLASKILDFLEDVEGTSNANGIQRGSYINQLVAITSHNLNLRH
jgi:hypothetical protein